MNSKEYPPYYWVTKETRDFMSKGYLPGGISVEERIKEIAATAEKRLNEPGFAEKFEKYMSYGWISLSTPVWVNFGNNNGLPISCNGSAPADDTASILEKAGECGMLTKFGAGTSGYFGHIRPRGSRFGKDGVSEGVMGFLRIFDTTIKSISQGSARRGAFAAYLPADHPDIMEFLDIRESGNPIQELQHGVTISDEFMAEVQKGKNGNPKVLAVWAKILERRAHHGYPYIMFSGNSNRDKPKVYKDLDMSILASNLCAEIQLPSSPEETFVCCLSSLNLMHWDEWKDTDLVETMTKFLDAVMEEYIEKTENLPFMGAAHKFAKRHRAIGLGVLGWHSYLHRNMIPFESMKAKFLTSTIFKHINEKSLKASRELAIKFGEPEILKGYGERMTTRIAIAPTTSSSFILGQVSPSIEPIKDNYYVKDLAKGVYTYKNPFLAKLLEEKGKDTTAVWKDILTHGGSVQHLDFLTAEEKEVFKTFGEISQKEIIIQASIRQKFICQSQSLNVLIPPKTKPSDISKLYVFAFENGIKTLYYQRSSNPAQMLARSIMTCTSCEG